MKRVLVGAAAVLALALAVPGGGAAGPAPAGAAQLTGPRITLSPAAASPGTVVVVRGLRFAHRARVSVLFDGLSRVSGTTTGSGTFTLRFHVPRATGGNHWVRARDATGRTVRRHLLVVQRIIAAPLVVAPYDQLCARIHVAVPYRVAVTVHGFGARATLPVSLAGVPVTVLTAGKRGSAKGTFVVPPETPGLKTLTVTDAAHGFVRHRVLLSQTFSCWQAVSTGSGLDWRWHGVGWDANTTVSLGIVTAKGRRVLRTATSGPRGSFGTAIFSTACPRAGTYPVTIKGRSQGRPFTVHAGDLNVFGSC